MLILCLIFSFFLIFQSTGLAVNHTTLIINQVRGSECCSIGNISNFQQQIDTLQRLQLEATFALRYDALTDPQFLPIIKKYQNNELIEWAAFLEITPQLAADASVEYHGSEDNWYEAQFAYLIGYSQMDRAKILATYMARFKQVFNQYPQSSVAWMIDPYSLQLLKTQYGVTLHEITREQMGVDSYTLYGGPAHYPYYPSQNWALIPSQNTGDNQTLPLIVRQTVSDPLL